MNQYFKTFYEDLLLLKISIYNFDTYNLFLKRQIYELFFILLVMFH